MQHAISFDASADILVIKTSGKMTQAGFLEMAEAILRHPRHVPGGNAIFDHTDLDFSGVTLEVLEAIRSFHRKNENRIGGGKSAIVVKPGFLKKWHELWSQGQKIQAQNKVDVFEDFSTAIRWVRE